VNNFGTTLRN